MAEEKSEDKHHGFDCLMVSTVVAYPSLMLTSNVSLHKHLKFPNLHFLICSMGIIICTEKGW